QDLKARIDGPYRLGSALDHATRDDDTSRRVLSQKSADLMARRAIGSIRHCARIHNAKVSWLLWSRLR
ncbi:MAG: hypothetical protein RL235_750, partial [Chlamydiota bacterium]